MPSRTPGNTAANLQVALGGDVDSYRRAPQRTLGRVSFTAGKEDPPLTGAGSCVPRDRVEPPRGLSGGRYAGRHGFWATLETL